jgi:two-component system sensor kinase FixL
MVTGVAVLAYNVVFSVALQWQDRLDQRTAAALAWSQIILDLICLMVLAVWTGGVHSPLLGLFVLHMVISSLLLRPVNSYITAGIVVGLVLLGLWLADLWPSSEQQVLLLCGWAGTLVVTVFLTCHITSSLRERDRTLRDQHRKLKSVLDTAADGIITIDDRGIIQSCNRAAEIIFGYKPAELIGFNVKLLMPEPYHREHDGYLANYAMSGKAKIIGIGREVVGRRKDGTVFPVDLAVSEVQLHGQKLFTGILRDITQRKQAEEQLLNLNQTLHRQQDALVQHEKMAAMGQMAAGVAHEIANPLASMDSLLQLVQRQPETWNDQTIVSLREQVERINRIVRELTSFAHPNESGWEVVTLNPVVENALKMVRFDHRLRRVRVQTKFDPNVGSSCLIPHSILQVLVNMIINALDAVANVDDPQITVATNRIDRWNSIEITDNGHGIAPENVHRVFEPFFTTKPVGKGTGLGLSISYSLIQRHGGSCDVTSAVGHGTTFRILLPASDSLPEGPAASYARDAVPAAVPESEKRQG